MAYRRGYSILDAAAPHCGARWMLKIDVWNFFSSMSERQVFYAFRSLNVYPDLLCFELARLCTTTLTGNWLHRGGRWDSMAAYQRYPTISGYARKQIGHLPQGGPSSPALSNAVCVRLDRELSDLAESEGLTYTRYSDDLCFSTASNWSRSAAVALINKVDLHLSGSGLVRNRSKTRVSPPGTRKIVLGLLVDTTRPRLPKSFKSKVDTHIRGIEEFGLSAHVSHRNFKSAIGFVRHLNGLVQHAEFVEPDWGGVRSARLAAALYDKGWS
jgi:RNA-directed DNA polymerase